MAIVLADVTLGCGTSPAGLSRLRSGGMFHDNDYLSPDAENR